MNYEQKCIKTSFIFEVEKVAGNSNQNGDNSNLKNIGNEKVEVEVEGNIILSSTPSIEMRKELV